MLPKGKSQATANLDNSSVSALSAKPSSKKSTSRPGSQLSQTDSLPAVPPLVKQQTSSEDADSPAERTSLVSRIDHLKKNIHNVYASDHDRFLNSMSDKTRVRYEELMDEIEACLDLDDPELFQRASAMHYENAYGYPPELQSRFEHIDNRIVELMAADPKLSTAPRQDILRERVEQREVKRRLKEIDERLEAIQSQDLDMSPADEREQLVKQLVGEHSQEQLKAIKDGIDMTGFIELEELDAEAIDMLKNIDFDSIERNLEQSLAIIEETERKLREEEAEHQLIDNTAELQKAQAFNERYSDFLGKNRQLLDEFRVSDKISSEVDLDAFEKSTMDKLRANGDMLEQWYQALESGRGELDQLEIDNKVILDSVQSMTIRDPDRFDEQLTEELKLKYPHIFRDKQPLPETQDAEDEEEEPVMETQADTKQQ